MGGGRSAREAWRCRARSIRGSGRELNCREVPGAPSADEEVTRGPALLRGAAPLEASSSAIARSVCGGGGSPEARSARQRSRSITVSTISKGTPSKTSEVKPPRITERLQMRRRGVRACGTRAKLGGIHTRRAVFLSPTHIASVSLPGGTAPNLSPRSSSLSSYRPCPPPPAAAFASRPCSICPLTTTCLCTCSPRSTSTTVQRRSTEPAASAVVGAIACWTARTWRTIRTA